MLPPEGALIIWTCIIHSTCHHTSDLCTYDHHSLLSESTSNGSSSDDDEPVDLNVIHSVTFKCIGANKERAYQATLEELSEILDRGSISTKIIPEPSNKFDSRALSFQCFHKGKWRLIGYVGMARETVQMLLLSLISLSSIINL